MMKNSLKISLTISAIYLISIFASATLYDRNFYIINLILLLIFIEIIELMVAWVYIYLLKVPNLRRILFSVLAANLFYLPCAYLIFPRSLLSAEIFIFIYDGCFVYILNKDVISLKKTLGLSFLMNLIGFIIVVFFIRFCEPLLVNIEENLYPGGLDQTPNFLMVLFLLSVVVIAFSLIKILGSWAFRTWWKN
jgi:hypothetical protein